MEIITLTLFCLLLLLSVILKFSVILALLGGLCIFSAYALRSGHRPRAVLSMWLSGILTIRNIILAMLLIGAMTALWRASGTIAEIICLASPFLKPGVFLLMCFVLNCVVSFLTGTSFGTAATMGVICAAMGNTLQLPILLTGGAVLSGVFFGDRCSPVSTSLLLVSELTDCSPYDIIPKIVRPSLLPFFLSCCFYLLLGRNVSASGTLTDLTALFEREFQLHLLLLLPAAIILALSLLRLNVCLAMTASILSAAPLCLLFQGFTPARLLHTAVFGFHAGDAQIATLMNGGGVLSMLRVVVIICISSAFAGIFERTELLTGIRSSILALSKKTTPFCAVFLSSVFTSMIACNQTLATMLTDQLCGTLEPRERFAIDMENSVILIAGLVPWSIAGGVPLSTIGAPSESILFAAYLYLVPLCSLLFSFIRQQEPRLQQP